MAASAFTNCSNVRLSENADFKDLAQDQKSDHRFIGNSFLIGIEHGLLLYHIVSQKAILTTVEPGLKNPFL